ncbi:MAG: hypothetical protein ACM3ML_38780 [Micromonosporaceae bacterium]
MKYMLMVCVDESLQLSEDEAAKVMNTTQPGWRRWTAGAYVFTARGCARVRDH